jgi:GT2 family glycosyltransferase
LDETYFAYMEDVALCERMKRASWQVWYVPTADVIHHMGQSTKRQTGKVSPSAIRSFHLYFQRRWGPTATRLLQAVELMGYGLRVALYGLGAWLLRRPRWREQAHVHRQYLQLVWSWKP